MSRKAARNDKHSMTLIQLSRLPLLLKVDSILAPQAPGLMLFIKLLPTPILIKCNRVNKNQLTEISNKKAAMILLKTRLA